MILRSHFLVFKLVFFQLKMCQTLKTVSNISNLTSSKILLCASYCRLPLRCLDIPEVSKHREESWKYDAQRSIFDEALVSRVWYITWSTRPQKIASLSVRLQEQIDSRRQNYSRSRAGFPVYCTLSLIKGSRVMWCLLDQSEISFDLVHVTFPRAFHGLLASASWLVHFSNYDVDVGGFLIALGYRCAITIAREISCHGCLFLFPI